MNLENVEDVYRLSPMQEGMLLHSISHPQSGVFVQQICHELIGEVEISSLQDTWQDIMQMFDVLRTVFLWDGLDEPLQVVRQQVEQKWSGLDWTGYTSEQHQEELSSLLANDRRTGFDLAKAPVGRHILIQLNPSHWWWLWSYHHIQLDGWSTSIVLQEFLDRFLDEDPDYSRFFAAGTGEDLRFGAAFRALEDAHVFDHAQFWNVHFTEHLNAFFRI